MGTTVAVAVQPGSTASAEPVIITQAANTLAPGESRSGTDAQTVGGIKFQQSNSDTTSDDTTGSGNAGDDGAEKKAEQASSASVVTLTGLSSQLLALTLTCYCLIIFDV